MENAINRFYSIPVMLFIFICIYFIVFLCVKLICINVFYWRVDVANAVGKLSGIFLGALAAAPYAIKHIFTF